MRNFLTIARREFTQLAHTPAIYCVLAAITLLYSLSFYDNLATNLQSNLQPTAIIFGWLSVFVVPVLTMRSFAGEEASGTIELLLTAPVRAWEVVAGKFVGCWGFYALSMLPLVAYAVIFASYGEVDPGELEGIFLGLLLAGAAQIATGLLASSLTGNIIVAAAGSCVANFFVMMLSLPVERGASVYTFPAALSWWSHFKEVFNKGILDSRSLAYFLSFLLLLLFLTWLRLVSRGLFTPGGRRIRGGLLLISVGLIFAGLNLMVFAGFARLGWRGMSAALAEGELFDAAWPVTVGAALLLAGGLLLGFDRKRNLLSSLRGEGGLNRRWPAWVAAVAAMLIFANVNYLANLQRSGFRLYQRWDLTANQTNTLTPALREAADRLESTLTVTVFFSEDGEYDGQPLAKRVRDLLGDLCSYSPRVKAQFFDAQAEPQEARAVGERMHLPLNELERMVTLEYEGRLMVLPAAAFLRAPNEQEMMAGAKKAFYQGELAMSVGLRRIADQRISRVLFTTGHGEMTIGKAGRDPQLCGMFAESLAREAFEVRPWLLTGTEEVPAGTDLLVLAGPMVPFTPEATQRLRDFADNGGRILLLLPSLMQSKSIPGIEGLLEYFGVKMRDDVVVDDKYNWGGQPTQILAVMEDGAGVDTGLQHTVVMLPDSRSLGISEERAKANNWQISRLLRSSEKSSQRYYPESKRFQPGPATLGVTVSRAAEGKRPESRMIILSSTSMASNLNLDSNTNKQFLQAACRWLTGRDYGIRPQERNYLDYQLNINADGLRLVWCLSVVELPLLWLLCAFGIWLLRRD